MIHRTISNALRTRLTLSLQRCYGELSFTQNLASQASFDKVPTYRLIDLDGKLLKSSHTYDTNLLVRILKKMIFVDEMDSILLKVKSQGIS